MKQITLTDQEANRLDTFLIMTSQYREKELNCWERLKDKAPAAKSNIAFWEETNELIRQLQEKLR